MRRSHHSQLLELVENLLQQVELVDSNITVSVSLLLVDPFILDGLPIIRQVHTLFSYMDPISDFIAKSQFAESRLIIASS